MVPSFLIYALLYGTLFALMAMGLTLTYMTTKVPNFAYGSFVTLGLYTAFNMKIYYNLNPYLSVPFAFVVAGIVSVIMYVGVLRPLARRGTPLVTQMIATFAVDIGFIGIIGIYTDYIQTKFPNSQLGSPKQFFALPGDFTLFGIPGLTYVAPLVLAGITLTIFLLFTRTRFGIAMRASVENPSLATVLGINVERVNVISWLLAGGFAGVAGSLYVLQFPGGTSTGSDLIVNIFAASVLGGLTSIFGAVVGGLVIGSSADIVTTELDLGFGYAGAGLVAALVFAIGAWVIWRRLRLQRAKSGGSSGAEFFSRRVLFSGQGIGGLLLLFLGIYILLEMASGFSTDFFVMGLVNGYGADVTPYQQAVPLLIMVATLLLIPKGIVSLPFGKLRRKGR